MISVLLIAVSLSMDAFAVSVTNAMTLRPFRRRYALWMGSYFGFFQCLMPLAGYLLGAAVSGRIAALGPYVSFVLLGVIGTRMILEALSDREGAGMQKLSHRQLLALAVATSIDALAVGVSFAFAPPAMGVPAACVLIGAVTVCLCAAGALLGSRAAVRCPRRAGVLGGCVLIAIGVKLLLEGLF